MKSDSILAHVPSMYINLIPAVDAAGDVSITVLYPEINVFYEANARSFPRCNIDVIGGGLNTRTATLIYTPYFNTDTMPGPSLSNYVSLAGWMRFSRSPWPAWPAEST